MEEVLQLQTGENSNFPSEVIVLLYAQVFVHISNLPVQRR